MSVGEHTKAATGESTPQLVTRNGVGTGAAPAAGRVTVWFDAGCPLCVREIALMRRLDARGAIDFVDVQGAGDCPLDRGTLLARLHARDADGRLESGAAAFAIMWRAVPVLRPLGLAARWRPLLSVLELGYRGFLRVRPSLQQFVVRLGLK